MCWGPIKRICHWGPLIALGIIKAVTLATVSCLSQWWPPQLSWSASTLFFTFMSSACLTLYFLLQAMYTGPGLVPENWQPVVECEKQYLQFCKICNSYKAPRAHHCRKCGRCVLKMDHHCPWINNCVGHYNHSAFTLFLFFAVVGCAQATVILSASIYRAIHRTQYLYYGTGKEPIVYMSLWGMVACMFVLGLAIGVVLAVGMLLFFQIRGILRNRTGIEDWILEKAIHRRGPDDSQFIYPYYLGKCRNFSLVLNFWCEPVGDGITWPVRDGCHQYTLTIEQLEQKAEKRARSREYVITRPYSGSWVPCTHGLGVFCHPPCTDEPRISLNPSDIVVVARWKRYWLYGERVSDIGDNGDKRHRGWFPRHCSVEIMQVNSDSDNVEVPPKPLKKSKNKKDSTNSKKKR